MDHLQALIDPSKQFAKDSIRLVKRCTKPDRKEYQKIAVATAVGFAIMGFIGFFVKVRVLGDNFDGEMKSLVICLSGKRKSGKDFVGNLLANRLKGIGYKVIIYGVSYPLKEEYAQLNSIDAERLKYDMQYKEIYRQDMIIWAEKIRKDDPGYFCKKVLVKADLADVLIVPDCRRLSDIEFFKTHCGSRLRLLRVESTLSMREMRGFVFTRGIDDKMTECDLDEYTDWDVIVANNVQIVNEKLPVNLDECLTRLCSEIHQLMLNQK
ncbi:Phosphomevalonate kinase [Dirofilaria immitis]